MQGIKGKQAILEKRILKKTTYIIWIVAIQSYITGILILRESKIYFINSESYFLRRHFEVSQILTYCYQKSCLRTVA